MNYRLIPALFLVTLLLFGCAAETPPEELSALTQTRETEESVTDFEKIHMRETPEDVNQRQEEETLPSTEAPPSNPESAVENGNPSGTEAIAPNAETVHESAGEDAEIPEEESAETSGENAEIPEEGSAETSEENAEIPEEGSAETSEENAEIPEEESAETSGEDAEIPEEGSAETSGENALLLSGRVICIDPGHAVTPLLGKGLKGPVSPLSTDEKPLYTEGTRGKHLTEERLNLIVGLKLRDALNALGAETLMTREVSEITISGVERCEIANKAGADAHIHIHADGVDSPKAHGVSVLVPTGDLLGTPSILPESVRLGELMVDCVAETTGAHNRGISPRSDMTGFNFSEVPTVLIEMGFMTNPEEDALLETDAYQDKIVQGMIQSLLLWYGLGD